MPQTICTKLYSRLFQFPSNMLSDAPLNHFRFLPPNGLMNRGILPKAKVACTDLQHLQCLNNPIIMLAKVERQRSELPRFAFPFTYPLSPLLDSCTLSL